MAQPAWLGGPVPSGVVRVHPASARTEGCDCPLCVEPPVDPGPPLTAVQRAYCDAFVEWFRASDIERERVSRRLDWLAGLVRR